MPETDFPKKIETCRVVIFIVLGGKFSILFCELLIQQFDLICKYLILDMRDQPQTTQYLGKTEI